MRLYTTSKDGAPRHVVASQDGEVEGKVTARHVCLHNSVQGKSRRGRPPRNKLVTYDASELTPLSDSEASTYLAQAQAAWAAGSDTSN